MSLAVALALGASPGLALAGPQGGVVEAGQVQIRQTTPTRMDIVQGSARGVINWQSFSIGAAEQVNFQQPSAASATLNRVIGVDPSVILGRITANGQVFLLNPNGMLFGQGSTVDVGGLVASTARLSTDNFMAGRLQFEDSGSRHASIVNQGQITAAQGGLVALVAPGVENAGVIRAQLGRVALASGHAFTLDLFGDQLIRLVVDDAAMDRLTDVHGRSLRSLVANSGRIEADGGTVLLAAQAARGALDAVINMSGVIQARGVARHGGEIVLHGGDHGAVQVAGVLDASGSAESRGGNVQVLGREIELAGTSRIDVSGAAGGGRALVGGDWQGGGALPRAANTTVQAGARIAADALAQGNGGQVVVWADRATLFAGQISARGGARGGDGGRVEVSGKQSLAYRGRVDAGASHGQAGTLLLDPTDWIIDAADADRLSLDLRGGTNVVLQADNEIRVNESIDGRGGVAGASLSLDAGNLIALNNDLLTNNGAINLRAGALGVQMGTASRATAGNGAVVSAGNQAITIDSVGSVTAQHLLTSGAIAVRASAPTADVSFLRDLNGLGSTPIGSLDVVAGRNLGAGGLNADGAATLSAGGTLAFSASESGSFAAGSVTATAGGAITVNRDVLAKGSGAVSLTSSGGALTMGAGGATRPTVSVASQAGGSMRLASAGRLTVGDLFTTGTVSLESTADTIDLTRDLLGAAGSNGLGAVTLRSGGALTIDNAIRSSGGIDIRAGGTTPAAARDLTIALAPSARLEANVANAGVRQTVALGGARVDLNAGEVHTNGGALTIDARNGRSFMAAGAGLFAGAGNITVQATDRVDLTRVSLGGDLAVTSTTGAIRLDGDLGSDLVVGGSTTPQPVRSVTLTAGGSYSQDRSYFTNYNFAVGPADPLQTAPTAMSSSPVGVRVRGIDASGPVTITATQAGAEILTDGVIDARGDVTLNASAVRARHSVFATGGNISVGGPLIVEPWGDEIVIQGATLLNSDTYAGGAVTDQRAPGSTYTGLPVPPGMSTFSNHDIAASQITLRATAAGPVGGGITLTGGIARDQRIRTDQQLVRLDRDPLATGFAPPAGPGYDRSGFPLVPMNDLQVNLQSSNGVTFRAGPGGLFAFTGPSPGVRQLGYATNLGALNESYLRLVLTRPDGTYDPSAQVVRTAGGVLVPDGFSGYLTSANGTPAGSGVPGGSWRDFIMDPTNASLLRLPGADYAVSWANPSGIEAPPGPTSVAPGLYSLPDITPGSSGAAGSGSAGATGSGIAIADARPITAAPPPPPVTPPAPAPAPTPAPTPTSPTDPTQATPVTEAEVLLATQPPSAGSTPGDDIGGDVIRAADLGRGLAVRGSAVDVFGARSRLTRLATGEPDEADSDYFGPSLFDYLKRRLTRGARK